MRTVDFQYMGLTRISEALKTKDFAVEISIALQAITRLDAG